MTHDTQALDAVDASSRAAYDAFEREALGLFADVRRFAQSLTRSPEDADDLVQDTYIRALRHWRQFNPGTNCRSWLFTICRRRFYRRWEREKRHLEIAERYHRAVPDLGVGVSVAFDVERRMETADMRARLARAVARLPGSYREVVELVHFHGRSYSEAACALGIRAGTVRSRLFRARILLRSELSANEPQAACA